MTPLPIRRGMDVYSVYQNQYIGAVIGVTGDNCVRVRPGRLNLGPLTHPLRVPLSAIRSISMERIVLDRQREQIPAAWR